VATSLPALGNNDIRTSVFCDSCLFNTPNTSQDDEAALLATAIAEGSIPQNSETVNPGDKMDSGNGLII